MNPSARIAAEVSVLELGIKSLIAYLMGSVIGSLLLGRFLGVDIRQEGSGNAGGTNALRTRGWRFALGVVIIDVGKAVLAVGWLPGLHLGWVGRDPTIDRQWLAVACATAVVIGHVYPVWHEFRGGKGAATLLGAIGVLSPMSLVPVALVWLACVMLTGFVGLASMLGTAALPLSTALTDTSNAALIAFGSFMTVFVAFTHRAKIDRMGRGIEIRALKVWLLRPR